MTESCSNCRFFRLLGAYTVCLRYPPQVVIEGKPCVPSVREDHWCGEWKQTKEAEQKQLRSQIDQQAKEMMHLKTVDDDNPNALF